MYKIFNKLETQRMLIPENFLSVESMRLENEYHDLEAFQNKYLSIYPQNDLHVQDLKIFEKTQEVGRDFQTEICFQKEEKFASPNHPYKGTKVNTYFMCPICDPFGKSHLGRERKTKSRDGQKVVIDANEPQFYDTLHSQYEHHLAQIHGVYKVGCAATPFVGFSLTQQTQTQTKAQYNLSCICPYNKLGENSPCLAEVKFSLGGGNENPFKGYFRHVHEHHCNHSLKTPEAIYTKQVLDEQGAAFTNFFVPLSMDKFKESLNLLQHLCGSEILEPIVLSTDQYALTKAASYVSPALEICRESTCLLRNPRPAKRNSGFDTITPQKKRKVTSSGSNINQVGTTPRQAPALGHTRTPSPEQIPRTNSQTSQELQVEYDFQADVIQQEFSFVDSGNNNQNTSLLDDILGDITKEKEFDWMLGCPDDDFAYMLQNYIDSDDQVVEPQCQEQPFNYVGSEDQPSEPQVQEQLYDHIDFGDQPSESQVQEQLYPDNQQDVTQQPEPALAQYEQTLEQPFQFEELPQEEIDDLIKFSILDAPESTRIGNAEKEEDDTSSVISDENEQALVDEILFGIEEMEKESTSEMEQ